MVKPIKKTSLLPREKALLLGLENLHDHELLSIIFGHGTKKQSVYALAKKVLKEFPLMTWSEVKQTDIKHKLKLGTVKTWQLLATIELGKRTFHPPTLPIIRTVGQVCEQVTDLKNKQREEVVCLYLNARHELIKKMTVAIGGLNYIDLHPRDVFSQALKLPCAGVILVHNHPSGQVEPSSEDNKVTEILVAAGKLLGIQLIDHVIVAGSEYYSFSEKRKIHQLQTTQ